MRSEHPIIYIFLDDTQMNELSGHFTNGDMSEFHSFESLSDMLEKLIPIVESTAYFETDPCAASNYGWSLLPKFKKLLIIHILYQQHNDWQGYVYGLKAASNVTFRSREELKSYIMSWTA